MHWYIFQTFLIRSLVSHLLFLCSDDIIRSLKQNGHFVLMISLDLIKSSKVRKASDQSNYVLPNISVYW